MDYSKDNVDDSDPTSPWRKDIECLTQTIEIMQKYERITELLKLSVNHIYGFEEEEAENVLHGYGFTDDELKEIQNYENVQNLFR